MKTFKHIVQALKINDTKDFGPPTTPVKEPISIFCPKPAEEPCRQSTEYRVSLGHPEPPFSLYHHHKKSEIAKSSASSCCAFMEPSVFLSNDGLSNQCLSPMYSKRYQHNPVTSMYNLDHLLSGSANIAAQKIAYHAADDEDDHITDFWIEDKFRGVGFEDCDDIEIETPLDLSLRKVVR